MRLNSSQTSDGNALFFCILDSNWWRDVFQYSYLFVHLRIYCCNDFLGNDLRLVEIFIYLSPYSTYVYCQKSSVNIFFKFLTLFDWLIGFLCNVVSLVKTFCSPKVICVNSFLYKVFGSFA